MAITPRQREAYDFIRRVIELRRQAPTISEICSHLGISSPSAAHNLLLALEREGLIRRIPNVSRGIELVETEEQEDKSEIPLLGVIAAGKPIEAILTYGTILVPPDMVGNRRAFALKVKGDSMIDQNIADGDFIICESSQTAENGQTVVALIDDSEATVKRFYRERSQIRLEPANPRYKAILIKPADRLSIQGIVTGVIRKYPH